MGVIFLFVLIADGMACNKSGLGNVPHVNRGNEGNSFDDMLREVQAKLHARKKL